MSCVFIFFIKLNCIVHVRFSQEIDHTVEVSVFGPNAASKLDGMFLNTINF